MSAPILGNGIYTMAEAGRLLGLSARRVVAWFEGWPSRKAALLRPDYSEIKGIRAISFLDFIDAAVATTLRHRHNVSFQKIRRLHTALANQWNTPHPFCREELYTDDTGTTVFCQILTEDGDRQLVDILRKQLAMPEILLPFLRKVEYNAETKLAQVIALTERVVLDPRRKYGKPIVRGTGMPTAILNACYAAEKSYEAVADWYNVSPTDVEAAVVFESKYSGLAA